MERVDHKLLARRMSKAAAEVLIDHVDGAAFVEAQFTVQDPARKRSALALMDAGLIRFVGYGRLRSRTRITEDGRAVLCHVLADYAEALVRAGYDIGGQSTFAAKASGLPLVDPASKVAEAEHFGEAAQL